MIRTGDILKLLERRAGRTALARQMPVRLQIINDPEAFVEIEFESVEMVDGMLVINATVNADDDWPIPDETGYRNE